MFVLYSERAQLPLGADRLEFGEDPGGARGLHRAAPCVPWSPRQHTQQKFMDFGSHRAWMSSLHRAAPCVL